MTVLGRRQQLAIYFGFSLAWALMTFGFVSSYASSSPHYQLIETSLGGTGLVNSASTNYQAQQSGAVIGVGTSTGTSYQVEAGHLTTGAPALSFGIIGASPSFGTFSPTATATATSQFEVIDYTSYGYAVLIYGNPPSNGEGTTIAPLSSNALPQTGVDQFGMNLVANSVPTAFGANPNYGQFGFGTVEPNYDTANSFRFDSGDEIAYSSKSSGETVYTISYIVDVANLTPGGVYVSTQNLLCVATY